MDMELYDSFDRLLSQVCTGSRLRDMEASRNVGSTWQELVDSGFSDLLVPEESGGAGLGWPQAWQVLFAAGYHGLNLPFGQTMVARGLLAQLHQTWEAQDLYSGCGFAKLDADGQIRAQSVTGALVADKFLFQIGQTVYRAKRENCQFEDLTQGGGFEAHVVATEPEVVGECADGSLAQINALVLAVKMAGAADRALSLTLSYANERHQFGRAIGRFQAVQQQVTEMAQRVYAMRMASQLGCKSESFFPAAQLAALAKAQTSTWAPGVARTAHAVHGAIGVTQEHDLQLVTRRLYGWARAQGGAGYWSAQLGQSVLASEKGSLDYMREDIFGSAKLGLTAA